MEVSRRAGPTFGGPVLAVDVPTNIAERLNVASVRRRWYPFDDDVIDWSIPLTAEWTYMPREHSALAGAAWFELLPVADQAFVERWEMTQLMRNIAHGEHLLNQGILAMLWTIDPYDPSFRYLLHEVAEECQHMAMFNHWVRHNADIQTVGTGEEGWGQAISAYTEELAVRLPEAFWVNVLLFEFVGDEFNQAMKGGRLGDDATRPMHPTLVGIGVAHTAEEARHIGYARKWLQQGMPGLDSGQVHEVQLLAELAAQDLIGRRSFLPLHYSEQLSSYVSVDEFERTLASSTGTNAMLTQLKKLLDEFETLRIVSPERMRAWEAESVFG